MKKLGVTPLLVATLLADCGKGNAPTSPSQPVERAKTSASASLPICNDIELEKSQISSTISSVVRRLHKQGSLETDLAERLVEQELGCSMSTSEHVHQSTSALGGCTPVLTCPQSSLAIDFCGTGSMSKLKNNSFFKQVKHRLANTSECLNDSCCWHDNCYAQNCVPEACIWTPQSSATGCDGYLLSSCLMRSYTRIPGTLPVLWEDRIGNCCDTVDNDTLTREEIVCEAIRVLLVDGDKETQKCNDAGGVGCKSANHCISLFATDPFPAEYSALRIEPPSTMLSVTYISGSDWSCDPSLGTTDNIGYRGTRAGSGAPVPNRNLCSLLGCVGKGCNPQQINVGTTLYVTRSGDRGVFLGTNDSNTGNNTGYLHICGALK